MRRKRDEEDEGRVATPAKVTAFHACDRELSPVAGAPKGFRRIDRLQWLDQSPYG